MRKRQLSVRSERYATAGAFIIARGAKRAVEVLLVEVQEGGQRGWGEATPVYYRGQTVESETAAVERARSLVESGGGRLALLDAMPAGAARNALDAALWDLEAKQAGRPLWELLGRPAPQPIATAFTISLAAPGVMEEAARRACGFGLLKVKLAGDGDAERLAAVRRGAPGARLIVDANEAWRGDVARQAAALLPFGVELIEQPVPAGQDHLLDGIASPIPLCADESVHDRATLDAVASRYAFVNIKLDKAGGLTEALALAALARARGLGLMAGSMLSTSLGVAPAFHLGAISDYADLDGPLLLASDRTQAIRYEGDRMWPPDPALWG